jgi:hypothetical protein
MKTIKVNEVSASLVPVPIIRREINSEFACREKVKLRIVSRSDSRCADGHWGVSNGIRNSEAPSDGECFFCH